jgi:predicted transcriptional regulator
MDTTTFAERVAATVTSLAEAHGITDVDLAARTNIPRTTLQRRLKDGNFTSVQLVKVAAALGTTATSITANAENAA